jgi:isopenicillin N synthase-like dioxygenase
MTMSDAGLPVIDVGPLVAGDDDLAVARAIDQACRHFGFFYVVGHGIEPAALTRLEAAARAFFALPEEAKEAIAMSRAGPAWRGWFPLGGELTSGRPDGKEGCYFGAELPPDDPRVRRGVPLHGANLFPRQLPELRTAVLDHLEAMTALGQTVLRGMALGLGLPAGWFADHLTADPLVLFRIFRYPPQPGPADGWGVAEHTDYGLLTLLLQDEVGGLEVRTADGWTSAPAVTGSFVCNLGDMLERLTGGRYRSTPHRVRNRSDTDRLSFPFFLDPGWDTEVMPLPLDGSGPAGPPPTRWDGTDVVALPSGSYGDHLSTKVGAVFPGLRDHLTQP